jgi:hypothetical protein
MDYLTCSSEPFEEPPTIQKRSDSPPPPFIESSCSDQSDLSEKDSNNTATATATATATDNFTATGIATLKAGEISPSATCGQRKLSTAIATTAESNHPTLAGRQTMVMPSLNSTTNSTTPVKTMHPRPPPRSAPPKAPRSGPPRPHCILERSTTSSCSSQRAVAPLPDLVKPKLHRAASAPAGGWIGKFQLHPPPLRLEAWSEPAAENFSIRGPNYLKDKKKIASEQSAFRLLTVDLINCQTPLYDGICAHPTQRIQQALRREEETGIRELPEFVFCVNLCVPGPPFYHKVSYFGIDNMEEILEETTPFGKLMNKFIFGDDDDFRNSSFKLIPRIVEGNFVVRKAVGSKPSILGKKIKQYYIRGERYFEIIVDIASDCVAQRIVKLALGCTKTMVVDMMYLLEGNEEEMLPERIFGGVRMKNIDFKSKDGKRSVSVSPPEE